MLASLLRDRLRRIPVRPGRPDVTVAVQVPSDLAQWLDGYARRHRVPPEQVVTVLLALARESALDELGAAG